MKKYFAFIVILIPVLVFSADQRIQYTEKMVGANHPDLADTLNRITLVGHNTDGTHKDNVLSGSNIMDNAVINAIKIADGSVTNAEFQYLGDVTSAIQSQLNIKSNSDHIQSSLYGGTGQNSSTSTGTPYVLSGVWSFKTPDQMRAIFGLSSTDNVEFARVRAEITSVCDPINNDCFIEVVNAGALDDSYKAPGRITFDNTVNMPMVRNNDNTATYPIIVGVAAPSTSSDTCSSGMIAYDNTYVYICRASNTWMRASHATW